MLAYEYGFEAEDAIKAISLIGSENAEMVINYLLAM
jgi:hypothetical protein